MRNYDYTKKPALKQAFLKISRKCFLVSTAEDLNSSQNKHNQRHDKRNAEYLSSSTVTCANYIKSTIKKAPHLREVECFFTTERLCEELSCYFFLILKETFFTRNTENFCETLQNK